MLHDPESSAQSPQHWSWKKITLWCFGILLIFIIAILVYDEKLEPYDDLLPTVTVVPDAKTNGFFGLIDVRHDVVCTAAAPCEFSLNVMCICTGFAAKRPKESC